MGAHPALLNGTIEEEILGGIPSSCPLPAHFVQEAMTDPIIIRDGKIFDKFSHEYMVKVFSEFTSATFSSTLCVLSIYSRFAGANVHIKAILSLNTHIPPIL